MAQQIILRKAAGKPTPTRMSESDAAVLGSIQRATLGTAALWDDANVTSITIGGGTIGADTAPSNSAWTARSAYAQATSNTTGADLVIGGGIGRRLYTVVDFSLGSLDTATVTIDGTANVLTEGTDFNAVTSNAVTATNLASAIDGLSGVSALAVSAVVYVTKDAATASVTIATGDATAWTVTSGADGKILVGSIVEGVEDTITLGATGSSIFQVGVNGPAMVGGSYLNMNNTYVSFGTASGSAFRGSIKSGAASQAVDKNTLFVGLGLRGSTTSHSSLLLANNELMLLGRDFDHAVPADPTLIIHSRTDPNTDNTQWGSWAFDTSNFVGTTGSGGFSLEPANGIVTSSAALVYDSAAGLSFGTATATSIVIGRSGVTTDFPSGSTVDFTGATISGLSFNLLNVGTTTAAVATGDLAAGDSTRQHFYDASAGSLANTVVSTGEGCYLYSTEATGRLQILATGTVGTVQTALNMYSFNTGVGNGSAITFAHSTLSGAPVLSEIHSVATDVTGGASESDLNFKVGQSGTKTQVLQLRGSDLLANFAGSASVTTRLRVGGGVAADQGDFSASDGVRSLEYDASAGSLALAGSGSRLNVGGSAAVANGDFAATDGTRQHFYDASAGSLAHTVTATGEGCYLYSTEATGRLQVLSEGTSGTLQTAINLYSFAAPAAIGNGSRITFAHATLSGAPVLSEIHSAATDITGGASESDLDFLVGQAGTATQALKLRGSDLAAFFGGTVVTNLLDVSGSLSIGTGAATSLAIGRSGVTTDFPSGSTVDFTGATVTGLSLTWSSVLSAGATSGASNPTITTGQSLLGADELTMKSTTTGNVTLDSGTTGAMDLGTGANAKLITIGNSTSSTSIVANVGTGNLDLGVNAVAHEVRIGSVTGTAGVTINTGTGGVDIATGTAIATVNLGTGGTGAKTLNLGSTASTSSTTIDSGTGTISIGTGAQARSLNFGTGAAAQTVIIGSTNSTSTTTINSGSGGLDLKSTGGVVQLNSLPLPGILSSTAISDSKSETATNLYTVPTGKTAVITGANVRVSAATAITVAASAGIGVAAGEDDIIFSQALTALLATTDAFHMTNGGGLFKVAAAAAVIKFGIDTGATGISQALIVDLIGYLV